MTSEQPSDQFEIKISILHKIMLTVILTVFLSISAGTYFSVKTESEVLRKSLIGKGKSIAQNIASSTKSAFWSLNWIFVEKLLQESARDHSQEIIYTKIVKPNGEVYLSDNKKYYGASIPRSMLVEKQTLLSNFALEDDTEPGLLLIHPVLIGKDTWYILLGLSLGPINEASMVLIKKNITWGSLIMLLAVGGAYFLARSISRPIIGLAQSTKAISDGDRSHRTQISSKDEIGLLSHSFNKMIKSIDQAETALIESNERFTTVLDSIDATIYVADMDTYQILFMNKYMRKSFGDDLVGKTCYASFRGVGQPCSHCTNDKLLKEDGRPAGVIVWEGQNPLTKRWYINHDRAIKWTDGRYVHLQIATDLTDLKNMENERTAVEEKLRQKHKIEAIGTLAGGIAHDFNNILSIIIGNAELASEDIENGESAHESLQEIMTASQRAKELVTQLLSFSRKTEHKKISLEPGPIVKETLKLLRASLPTSIAIESDVSDRVAAIKADPTQIHQILINLCTNAAHAMEQNGGILQVTLSNRELDRQSALAFHDLSPGFYVQLSVIDSGHGIDSQTKERVFDPYFTTKGVGKGTGMGMAVVHGIVKSHHGEIVIQSEPNQGTRVDILFPVTDEPPVTRTDDSQTVPGGSESIMLVDDENSILNMGRAILGRLGYRVTTFADPFQALDSVSSDPERFDLVITDMTMPRLDGDRLIQEIHNIVPHMPVILCSGYSKKMTPEKAIAIGAQRYLEKPINKHVLAHSVREILDASGRG
jgi:signal transduction histidine kinase/ActR/RegA family two-component response regulator/HAMP domain-containing protein